MNREWLEKAKGIVRIVGVASFIVAFMAVSKLRSYRRRA